MFNNYYAPSQRVNINAVSGTISKTCEKSFFKYAKIGSELFKDLMSDKPRIEPYDCNSRFRKKDVVILQSMCLGNNYMMFELIWLTDFELLSEMEQGE